jgi:hypothetical protein
MSKCQTSICEDVAEGFVGQMLVDTLAVLCSQVTEVPVIITGAIKDGTKDYLATPLPD